MGNRMTGEVLTNLTIISIKKGVGEIFRLEEVIDKFAANHNNNQKIILLY